MLSNIKNKKLQLKAMLLTLSIILASSSCSMDTEAEETPRKPIIYDYDNSFPSETEEADVYPTLEEFINKDIYD